MIRLSLVAGKPAAEERNGEQAAGIDQALTEAVELADEEAVGVQHLGQGSPTVVLEPPTIGPSHRLSRSVARQFWGGLREDGRGIIVVGRREDQVAIAHPSLHVPTRAGEGEAGVLAAELKPRVDEGLVDRHHV